MCFAYLILGIVLWLVLGTISAYLCTFTAPKSQFHNKDISSVMCVVCLGPIGLVIILIYWIYQWIAGDECSLASWIVSRNRKY